VRRSGATVVISGPFWNLTVRPSGAFTIDIEYTPLEELIAELTQLDEG
jgi:hypothetical protein